ncbi:MBL fold metallo-hydrolase [Aduncisulcus paluster]|uniref:MBL fold metallo-hydrolase n=1 Tax=Aduncisulcus paluster TaxID=2918883 RepID=A0ABQ5KIR6_9EUKA|nr:MBL fold metallo-hydrolase [Aduncisulcus paluster]|eukprot:gnl/Carplike_NY0171/1418_a1930_1222.p1 GENE.gnl/Carplike_NY0171/1418_a1930_1222~~gnl/Carplike_NY0171/1418_a1930_1222.p1  ORF type:complete len:258 (-),score=42.70 gnl/Carplike_NY0171/1418_a1930_1222:86-859(-)
MKITQIRNATQILEYAGKKILIDPMLADKDAYEGFQGTVHSEIRIPTVSLPLSMEIILDVDAIFITHTHPDHWDSAAVEKIPKETLIFVQNKADEEVLRSQDFTNLKIFTEIGEYEGIKITPTKCQHGYDILYSKFGDLLGEVHGIIFEHPGEPKIYFASDTIWIPAVEEIMKKEKPDVVVLNCGWAHFLGFGPIIMGKEDIIKTHITLPEAKIVATHLEAVNHTLVTRDELKKYAIDNKIDEFVFVPADGETITLV